MLDMTLHTEKPVCVTGAMRGASDTSWDGPGNILAAVKTAASDDAVGQGVLVVLNDVIHAAREVTKTHSVNTDTFQSHGGDQLDMSILIESCSNENLFLDKKFNQTN